MSPGRLRFAGGGEYKAEGKGSHATVEFPRRCHVSPYDDHHRFRGPHRLREGQGAAPVAREGESGSFCTDCGNHMPSFRRFRRLNVTGDRTPVKGWRDRGIPCESGTDNPAADAPEFEGRGLEGKGISGRA